MTRMTDQITPGKCFEELVPLCGVLGALNLVPVTICLIWLVSRFPSAADLEKLAEGPAIVLLAPFCLTGLGGWYVCNRWEHASPSIFKQSESYAPGKSLVVGAGMVLGFVPFCTVIAVAGWVGHSIWSVVVGSAPAVVVVCCGVALCLAGFRRMSTIDQRNVVLTAVVYVVLVGGAACAVSHTTIGLPAPDRPVATDMPPPHPGELPLPPSQVPGLEQEPPDRQPSAAQACGNIGCVTYTVPGSWRIVRESPGRSVMLSDGGASFSICLLDAGTRSPKLIAESGRTALGVTGIVTGSGPCKIGGRPAYWCAVKEGSGISRIIGVDGPVPVLIWTYAHKQSFPSYRAEFNRMQNAIRFRE